MRGNILLLIPTLFILLAAQTERRHHVLSGLDHLLENRKSLLSGKNVGIVTNQTGLDRNGVPIWERIEAVALFSPEHGLFGEISDGESVVYDEPVENLPRIYSLYGKTRKPTAEMLQGIDLLLYDIQDVGARCYTFITTMGLVMEAAGEAGIPVYILDRPNPLSGVRIGGPTLELDHRSFVGYYPIPLQYGLTPGELARMIVGEEWIGAKPVLEVIPLISWNRTYWYDDASLSWVPPSPNIPDVTTAILYPGMVFLEATNVSEGRGTSNPFRWIGAPWIDGEDLSRRMYDLNLPGVQFSPVEFTPRHLPGVASYPEYEGEHCEGIETTLSDRNSFQSVKTGIALLIVLRQLYPDEFVVRNSGMVRLSGSDLISRGLDDGWSLSEIVSKYREQTEEFRQLSEKYLLY